MCISFIFCQTKKDQEEEEVDIATCSRGQYFGELALVTNKPRAASAYAVGSVKCLGTFCAIIQSFINHVNFLLCFSLFYITLLELSAYFVLCFFVFFCQSWTLKPLRGCWARAWTSWRETLLTMRSSLWPCLAVALRLSNKVREMASIDCESVDEKRKRLVRMSLPTPNTHSNSFSYKKCEHPPHLRVRTMKLRQIPIWGKVYFSRAQWRT